MRDFPKSLASPIERERRRAALSQKHIQPLTHLVDRIRREQRKGAEVPYFDPLDGGIRAQCLFVLEAPGKRAVSSGFISRSNPDETAKNMFCLSEQAHIDRRVTLLWNIVPWYIGTGTKIRPARKADIDAGLPYLYRLIKYLPDLRTIALVGRKAQQITNKIKSELQGICIYHCFHPSPLFVNRKRGNREVLINQLKEVGRSLR